MHVDDVADAFVRAVLDVEPWEGPVNIGSGDVHPIGEVAGWLSVAVGGLPPVVTGEVRDGDVRDIFPAIGRAAELGWKPQVALADGIRKVTL